VKPESRSMPGAPRSCAVGAAYTYRSSSKGRSMSPGPIFPVRPFAADPSGSSRGNRILAGHHPTHPPYRVIDARES
jgi:hypothetical protein